jgi:dipeptidyl-peptidase-4
MGYHLRPENKRIVWQGESANYTYIDNSGNLVAEDAANGVAKTLFTPAELKNLVDTSLKNIPGYSWYDSNTLQIRHRNKEYRIDATNKTLTSVATVPQNADNLTYSKAARKYAYTVGNNLYIADEQGNNFAVTADSDKNIVNGQSVSRNEFGINSGIFWSPDGAKLAFYRKDESAVSVFPLLDITTRTGTAIETKYPMAGMASEHVSLGVFDLTGKQTHFLDVTDFSDERYLTNITWSPESDLIYIQVLNRGQDTVRLNKYDATTGKFVATLFEESSTTYIEPSHTLKFIGNKGDRFIYIADNRDGYRNLYLHSAADGKLLKRLTPVAADVDFKATDPNGRYLFYTSYEVSPVEEHLFRTDLKTGKTRRLTTAAGVHWTSLSGDCSYFIDNYSSLHNPATVELRSTDLKTVRRLHQAKNPLEKYAKCEITLGSIKADDGSDLYYRLIKPAGFDSTRKYPVVQYVYGGPHSQLVKNNWNASASLWELYMAQRGYVVFVMDNHGTSNRGRAFEHVIHRQCGQREMVDQVKGVAFLKSHNWVDEGRIGLHGWSYGGFMTISLITNHPDLYKAAVAGGPVIDWQWYEVMYGERYMDTPAENPDGYSKTSLINTAKNLKCKLLICHGLVDATVVIEHSLSFVRECIKNGVQVDYFPYPLAEHNVFGRDRVHLMRKITDYLETGLSNCTTN